MAPLWPAAAGYLAAQWNSNHAWTVLDTQFDCADRFLDLWHCWRNHANRPHILHVVAVLSHSEALHLESELTRHKQATVATQEQRERAHLAATLAAQCYGLGSGFHRMVFEGGLLSLTLCVGTLDSVLAQQDMLADCVLGSADSHTWDKWTLKALARHCKRGSHLWLPAQAAPETSSLEHAGFTLAEGLSGGLRHATFNPRWVLKAPRYLAAPPQPGRCAIVGAGIAGASVAHALALRGWEVTVLDRAPQSAAGASGLPLGLVVPHHSSDDSPRSQMSRAGTRLMRQHASTLLRPGQDWSPAGVLERLLDAHSLDAAEAEVLSQCDRAPTKGWAEPRAYAGGAALWHPHAAWIKPKELLAQWLRHPGIRFQGQAAVHQLVRVGTGEPWRLLAADGAVLAEADSVVFANAYACAPLVQGIAASLGEAVRWVPDIHAKLALLQSLHGTTSMGLQTQSTPDWPQHPVNGHGSFVCGIPTESGPAWYAGSTFHTQAPAADALNGEHAANWGKLHVLLPQVAHDLAAPFASGDVDAWQGTRCVTHDRLPLVGPLEEASQPSLWLSTGMGARGLSFSALCAELLAAWMLGEPLPVESKLAKGLSTRRVRRQRAG